MTTTQNKTLSEIVSDDFKAATVFNKYGLDFCCKGNRTLDDACSIAGLDTESVANEIKNASDEGQSNMHYNYWSADFLADYIVNNHHAYVRRVLPVILTHSEKAATRHGSKHNELIKINEIFREVADEMIAHMNKEEKMLFPYIKHLAASDSEYVNPPFGNVSNPINVMEHEHKNAGDAMAKIRELTSNYNTPEDLCETCRVLYKELNDFERDLHVHVHLENNILFPMAMKIEKEKVESFKTPNACQL